MTCTNKQVKLLMKKIKSQTLLSSSAQTGMDVKTARKYIKSGKLPSELKKKHTWKTRVDPFEDRWSEIEKILESAPLIQAKTVFTYLQEQYPGHYKERQLRTLQRKFSIWRAIKSTKNLDNLIVFPQVHCRGNQSQSDYTVMNKLNITICGEKYNHLLFHYMLVYSRWEYVEICYTESFETLVNGFENAVWELGYVAQDHRTDNLSAATKKFRNKRTFTDKWSNVMKHYKIKASRNNPGISNENGSIEKSHDLFKNAVNQYLMLRGSRDFESIESYKKFLRKIADTRNKSRRDELKAEVGLLKELPNDKWSSPKQLSVRVSKSSVVHIQGSVYSVPSRFIGSALRSYVYQDKIEIFFGNYLIQKMPKITKGSNVNYRHIIDGLIRKPGAFKNYKYRECLFPMISFRKAYDQLCKKNPINGEKHYLKILYLAKQHGEQAVNLAIELLLDNKRSLLEKEIRPLLETKIVAPEVNIKAPNLSSYNALCSGVV